MRPAADHWTVKLQSGLSVAVPPATTSMTTFVLLEQERWFEPEMSLLPRLLRPGMHALDIGANHGVYALEIARITGSGQVLAFEPTVAPRTRLLRSIKANGMEARITVVPAGLAEKAGTACFAIHGNSELNSRSGASSEHETVHLLTLDACLAELAPALAIGFVKLDAEGDELRVLAGAREFFATQSPVVMFEFKHGGAINSELLGAWDALGFEIFRWSADLELLLPFDAARDETAFALNLFALRPAAQRQLSDDGLLVRRADLAAVQPLALAGRAAAALQAWCAQPALQGVDPIAAAAADDAHAHGLAAVAIAHFDSSLRPAERAALMVAVRDALRAQMDAGARLGPAAWALLVHAMQALGDQHAAVQLASQLLARWPAGLEIEGPFAPPRFTDLARARSTAAASWLRQVLAEYIEQCSSFSSYFKDAQPQRLAALLQHPDHAAEIERRYLLAHLRRDSAAPLAPLSLLPAAAHTCNSHVWRGLMAAMRAEAESPEPA